MTRALPHRPATTAWGLLLGSVLVVLACAPGWADEIDEAAALAPGESAPRLEALLESAESEGRPADAQRAHALLARIRIDAGEPFAALQHLEVLARTRGGPEDQLAYAETLLVVARNNMQARSTAAGVVPYLQDALAALDKGDTPASQGPTRDRSFEARQVLTRAEILYVLRRYDEVVAGIEHVKLHVHGVATRRRMMDVLARARYAQGQFEASGAAFELAHNLLGAAAAYDAAKQPKKSVRLYARAARQRPGDATVLARALRGAAYTGGEAALLEALAPLELPAAEAALPLLLARADLLEATGRVQEALAPLRTAAQRAPQDPSPHARLGRVILLTGDVEADATWDEAANAYARALALAPENDAALEGLYYIAGRDYRLLWKRWRDEPLRRRCLRVQRALAKARPDDSLGLSNLANTLRVLGDLEGSLATYALAREANPYDPSVRSDQGLALSAAGRTQASLTAYLDSIELDAGHLAGRQNAARALWLQGEDDRAAAHLGAATRTARAVGRGPGTYRFLLGRTWRASRKSDLR